MSKKVEKIELPQTPQMGFMVGEKKYRFQEGLQQFSLDGKIVTVADALENETTLGYLVDMKAGILEEIVEPLTD